MTLLEIIYERQKKKVIDRTKGTNNFDSKQRGTKENEKEDVWVMRWIISAN